LNDKIVIYLSTEPGRCPHRRRTGALTGGIAALAGWQLTWTDITAPQKLAPAQQVRAEHRPQSFVT
jgi:hypothetical protein